MSKTTKLLKSMAPPKLTPIATEMILPNLSGIASHPEAHNNFLKLDASNDPITENLKVFGVITCHGLTIIPDGIGGIPNIAMVNASSDNAKIEIGDDGTLKLESGESEGIQVNNDTIEVNITGATSAIGTGFLLEIDEDAKGGLRMFAPNREDVHLVAFDGGDVVISSGYNVTTDGSITLGVWNEGTETLTKHMILEPASLTLKPDLDSTFNLGLTAQRYKELFVDDITLTTNINVGSKVIHDGDTNTYISFTPDQIDFYAGAWNAITIDEAITDTMTFRWGSGSPAIVIKETGGPVYTMELGGTTNSVLIGNGGNMSFKGTAGFYPRRVSQAAEPANGTGATQIDVGETIMWHDTDDDTVWHMYNDTTAGIVKIKLE